MLVGGERNGPRRVLSVAEEEMRVRKSVLGLVDGMERFGRKETGRQ